MVHHNHELLGGRRHDFLFEESPTTTLDKIETAIDLIRANDGEITTHFPVTVQRLSEGSFSGELNGGGHRLSIRSNDGDIRLMN